MSREKVNDLFTPDSETAKRYAEQVRAVLASEGFPANKTIDMGSLPKLYTELGIEDKELKTNITTMLKALGIKGRNRHHVPPETLENLLSLVHDPEAVCRSLAGSDNPKSYVAMLNAKAEDGQPIIAILRPSEDEKGYTFIPSVYEKNNFERYLAQFAQEGRGLYVKEKGSELWGRLQSPPRHNSEPYNSIILTKEDIVKRISEKKESIMTEADFNREQNNLVKLYHGEDGHNAISQKEYDRRLEALKHEYNGGRMPGVQEAAYMNNWGKPAPYGAEKNKSKERDMSDVNENAAGQEEKQALSPAERAFAAVIHQRGMIGHALKEGTLSCLPGADGYADTSPAMNIMTGNRYHGATLLQLKDHQKANGFPTGEYVSQDVIKASGIPIRAGQRGIDITFNKKDKESGEWENITVRVFNAAQTARPQALKEWAAKQSAENREEYNREQFGDSYKPPERSAGEKLSAPEITCTSTEPEKYLGQYLAAVSMGGKFKATPEQAAEFKQNLGDAIWEKSVAVKKGEAGTIEMKTNPFKLSEICNAAGERCKEVIKEVRTEQRLERLEQQQQQTQSRGGMGR